MSALHPVGRNQDLIDEALGIYVEDIVLIAGQEGIRFRSKGEYEREVPLPFEFESLKVLAQCVSYWVTAICRQPNVMLNYLIK